MQNLLDFIAKNFHWLIFLLLETVSGILLFGRNSYQGSVWISSANIVTGALSGWRADVEHFFTLTRVNEELTQRNLLLEQRVAQMTSGQGLQTADSRQPQSDRPPLTSNLSAMENLEMIPAKVVSNSVDKKDNLITIDRGRSDGVDVDMGVASGTGLVGVVYMVGEHYSIVLPVLNSRSRISCAIRGRGYFGYLTWEGGSPVEAYVEDIPRHAKFKKGDWVETSGYSSIFPQGISVGRVTGIYNSPDGLSYRLKVHLSTDFACLRDVCIINGKSLLERQRLEESAADSLKLKIEN